jgi:iron complex transport system permease protein
VSGECAIGLRSAAALSGPLLATMLLGLIGALFVASLAVGPAPIPFGNVVAGLFAADDSVAAVIVQELRLPRAVLAVLVGASLGMSGAALQGLLRNPLAEPGLIGASGSAALGAVLALQTGLALAFPLALPLCGVLGALLSVALLYLLAGRESSILTLVLAGVAVSSLAGAATALVLNYASNPFAVFEIVFWLLGSLADRSVNHIYLAAPLMAAGWILLLGTRRALDALSLGEDTARSLGVDLGAAKARLVLGTALTVGPAVAVAGTIGFVGLVVPHLLRPFVGGEPGRLLGASALGGAVLLLAADIATRLISVDGRDLKLGVITALIGAPFFLVLILRTRRTMR